MHVEFHAISKKVHIPAVSLNEIYVTNFIERNRRNMQFFANYAENPWCKIVYILQFFARLLKNIVGDQQFNLA